MANSADRDVVRVFSDVLVAFLYFEWQKSKYGKATLTSEKARINPDETPRFWVYAICKCSLFEIIGDCINALTTSPQLRTLNFRQGTPLINYIF